MTYSHETLYLHFVLCFNKGHFPVAQIKNRGPLSTLPTGMEMITGTKTPTSQRWFLHVPAPGDLILLSALRWWKEPWNAGSH